MNVAGGGRALPADAKPRRRSWLRKQSAQALLALDDTRAYRPVARGGLSCYGCKLLPVKFPSGGFGHINAKMAGPPLPGLPN